MPESEINVGSWWTHKSRSEKVRVLRFGPSTLGWAVWYMKPNQHQGAMTHEDFLSVYEPRRRTIYEHLLDED